MFETTYALDKYEIQTFFNVLFSESDEHCGYSAVIPRPLYILRFLKACFERLECFSVSLFCVFV